MHYDTRDCLTCGHPTCDHVPLRYVLRPWVRHYLLSKLAVLSKGWR